MSIYQGWLDRKINDNQILAETNKLIGTQKGRSLLIITGSYVVQHFDYIQAINQNPNLDVMIMNFGYLLPGAENFRWIFHGSMGYTKAFQTCTTFKYFCRGSKGNHLFMTTTANCKGAHYPIASKNDVVTTIKNNEIENFKILTHAYAKKGLGYVADSLEHYTAAHIPYGCGGTLNAMALPFALQLGYTKIYCLGIGDQHLTHFYDVAYVQPHLRKPITLPHRNLILDRYRRLNALANNSGTTIYVCPGKYIEENIRKIFTPVMKI